VDVELTGHENASDLLNILGLDPTEHRVTAGTRTLGMAQIVPPYERITIQESHVSDEHQVEWNDATTPCRG
jgi:hypothetical protein